MIELSKRVVSIAKTLNVQKPVRENLLTILEQAVDIDHPLGNKMGGGYILNVVNNVAVDICVKRPEAISGVKCYSCNDSKTIIVFEVCNACGGSRGDPLRSMICIMCEGTGEFKTIIPCQDCKTEN